MMLKILYRIYQLFIGLPYIVLSTILTTVVIAVGSVIGLGRWVSYYPGKWWAWSILKVLLIPVKVEGREHLRKGESYVFVSNHQGAFDIFLIYGHLGRDFRWMMKYQLRKIPFLGYACAKCHHIFIDKRGASRIKKSYDEARDILRGGISLVVFPEGSRSFTGHMGFFRRGAFMLADELQLPVVPLTINGSFDIMPRTSHWCNWHPLRLTIHEPIGGSGSGEQGAGSEHTSDNVKRMMDESYKAIEAALVPEYRGYVENPDQ